MYRFIVPLAIPKWGFLGLCLQAVEFRLIEHIAVLHQFLCHILFVSLSVLFHGFIYPQVIFPCFAKVYSMAVMFLLPCCFMIPELGIKGFLANGY